MKVGDTVQLKSGGPIMTIKEIDGDKDAWCQWFAGKEVKESGFPAASLKAANPDAGIGFA